MSETGCGPRLVWPDVGRHGVSSSGVTVLAGPVDAMHGLWRKLPYLKSLVLEQGF